MPRSFHHTHPSGRYRTGKRKPTERELAVIALLIERGHPRRHICEMTGRTEASLRCILQRQGWQSSDYYVTTAEVREMRGLLDQGISCEEVSRRTGRTTNTIRRLVGSS